MLENKSKNPLEQNYVKSKEMIFYLAAIFFYTMMTGMVGSYRQAYLVNVLRMEDDAVSFYNAFLSVAGFLMSFAYSLDDFVISYYTTGADFQTLPLKIFAMTKKTVKPDMYALSTLMFFAILILLIVINVLQEKSEKKNKGVGK